jgi:hypothetical protein
LIGAAAVSACAALSGVGDLVVDGADSGIPQPDAQPPPPAPLQPPPPPIEDGGDGGSTVDAGALLYPCDAGSVIAYWPANEDGGSILHDCSPAHHDGQFQGTIVFGPGRNGRNAVRIVTANSLIAFPAGPDLDTRGPFTVSLWASIDPADTKGTIIGRALSFNEVGWALFYAGPADLRVTMVDEATGLSLFVGPQPITPLTATHLAVVFRPGSALELWVAGALAKTADGGAPAASPPYGNLQLGYIADGTADRFGHASNLTLQDIRMFSRALKPQEIAVLAAEP